MSTGLSRRPFLSGSAGALAAADVMSHVSEVLERRRKPALSDKEAYFFLGVNLHDHTPVVVPADVFCEGAYFIGSPGTGKTTGLIQLAEQAIDLGYSLVGRQASCHRG